MAAGATRALDELVKAGIVHTVHEYAAHEPSGRGSPSGRRCCRTDRPPALSV